MSANGPLKNDNLKKKQSILDLALRFVERLKLILKRPSLHPYVTSIAVGLFAALLFNTNSWLAWTGAFTSYTIGTCLFLGCRNFMYYIYYHGDHYNPDDEEDREEIMARNQAGKAGYRAAESYVEWGKSFLDRNAWCHPLRFGGPMLAKMMRDEEDEIQSNIKKDPESHNKNSLKA